MSHESEKQRRSNVFSASSAETVILFLLILLMHGVFSDSRQYTQDSIPLGLVPICSAGPSLSEEPTAL
jgi:hypothetical protein